MAAARVDEGNGRNTGSPAGGRGTRQPTTREGKVGPAKVAEKPVLPLKLGKCRPREGASGGRDGEREQAPGVAERPITPMNEQECQTSSHA